MPLSRALALLQAVPALGAGSAWIYAHSGDTEASAEAQAETWDPLCIAGHEQSPINIVTAKTAKTATPSITTHFDTTASYVKNTGHGFQLFETSPQDHAWNNATSAADVVAGDKGYSVIGGAKYNFYQVHWHTPSENTIDGKSFPLEAHFVHQLDDDALHGSLHNLAVIGLLYDLGSDDECNEFLEKFWGDFPVSKGAAEYAGQNFDLNEKLTQELAEGYYHWYGSLTTPPCTEGVSWNLLKKTEKVCQAQVDHLKQALASTQDGIGFNNRVVQPLYHRIVAETGAGGTTAPANIINLESQDGTTWKYAAQGATAANRAIQESTWKGLCAAGREQSPIDVVTDDVKQAGEAAIVTEIDASLTFVSNTGHGFQLFKTSPIEHKWSGGSAGEDDSSESAKGFSTIAGDVYNFYQVHWHTPSENTIDGESFPLEAHFVHQLNDDALHGTYHRLAVVGMLYTLGSDDECNEFLDSFWASFPTAKGDAQYTKSFDSSSLSAKLSDMLSHGYYHWYGSLTTPPCTEGVSWNLMKMTEKVCQAQVDVLVDALKATQDGLGFNNRVTQPLNHRVVTLTTPKRQMGANSAVQQGMWGVMLAILSLVAGGA